VRHVLFWACLPLLTALPGRAQDEPVPAAVRDATDEGRIFVEVVASRRAAFVQELVRLELRFGVERELLAGGLLQLFQRPLDVPVQISAPWLDDLPGALARGGGRGDFRRRPGERHLRAERGAGPGLAIRGSHPGRPRVAGVLDRPAVRAFQGGRAGRPRARLRFARASRFAERPPARPHSPDREDAVVRGEPLVLEVKPLPEAGRPAWFTGRWDASPSRPPRPWALMLWARRCPSLSRSRARAISPSSSRRAWKRCRGGNVLGLLDERQAVPRRIVYDLVPENDRVREVPPIRFAYFDPEPPGSYRTRPRGAFPSRSFRRRRGRSPGRTAERRISAS